MRKCSFSITGGRCLRTIGTRRSCIFLNKGYRVIAHDRRGHGRSTQTEHGNEMDTNAADVAALTDALDIKDAIHIGHSTGGGEVARYSARAQPGRVRKAVLIGAVPPIMLQTDKNPGGLPIETFDGFRAALAASRAQFYLDVPSGPFYGFKRLRRFSKWSEFDHANIGDILDGRTACPRQPARSNKQCSLFLCEVSRCLVSATQTQATDPPT